MTLELRNNKNQTLIEISLFTNEDNILDVRSSVNIEHYSNLLLFGKDFIQGEIIEDFNNLSEIRGWFWEVYHIIDDNPTLENTKNEILSTLEIIAKKYNLNINQD